MPGKVILGAQWGDEGKGKFIDIFAGKADLVVRSQGGNNAGHTVVAGGEKYKLQLIPSGILYPKCVNVIGPGVVVNPKAVLGEIDGLHEKGVSTDKLFIDARCHCIMPWHLELDALSEAEKARLRDLDVLMIPVGGFYTIGPEEAWALVRDLRPRVTVPMHYRLGRVGLPAVQELGDFLALADGVVRYPTDTLVVDAQTPRQVAVLTFGK